MRKTIKPIAALLLLATSLNAQQQYTQFNVSGSTLAVVNATGTAVAVTQGNTYQKTNVFVSSYAATVVLGSSVVLSSRTTTPGKVFYLQHFDGSAFFSDLSTSTTNNLGSISLQSPSLTILSTMTFISGPNAPRADFALNFDEPVPIPQNTAISAVVRCSTGVAVTWISNLIGYER